MVPRRAPAHAFVPGHKKFAGRKKGSVNRATRALKEAVLLAAEQTGENKKGRGGLLGYLRMLAKTEPRTFAALLVKAIPMEIAGDANRPLVVTLDPAVLQHLSTDHQEVLRDVLRAIDAGGPIVDAVANPKPATNPSRYGEMLSLDSPTDGQA